MYNKDKNIKIAFARWATHNIALSVHRPFHTIQATCILSLERWYFHTCTMYIACIYTCRLCEDAIELTSLRVKMNKLRNKCRNDNGEKCHTLSHSFNILCKYAYVLESSFLFLFFRKLFSVSVWFLSFKSQFNVAIKHERAQYLWL